MKKYIYISCLLCLGHHLCAQVLNEASRREIELPGGIKIIAYASLENSREYYYLPATLQVSVHKGQPEMSLMVYRQGNNGPIDGGLLHLLVSWGLTSEQEQNVNEWLRREVDSLAVLAGAAEITFPDKDIFSITGNNAVAHILRRSVTSPVRLPLVPGHKTALAFRFNDKDAAAIWDAVHSPKQLSSVKFTGRYYYIVARYEGPVRKAEQKEGNLEGIFRQWIENITRYNLLKTATL